MSVKHISRSPVIPMTVQQIGPLPINPISPTYRKPYICSTHRDTPLSPPVPPSRSPCPTRHTSNIALSALSMSNMSGSLESMLSASSYTISSLVLPPPLLASLGCTSRIVVMRVVVSWVCLTSTDGDMKAFTNNR